MREEAEEDREKGVIGEGAEASGGEGGKRERRREGNARLEVGGKETKVEERRSE